MRSLTRALAIAALGSVLWPGVARASLASDVFSRAFGEASPTTLAFHVDLAQAPVKTHPLGYLHVSLPALASELFTPVRFDPQDRVNYPGVTMPQLAAASIAQAPEAPAVAYYEDALAQPTSPPTYSRFDLDGASGGLSEEVLVPGRVGSVYFVTHAGADQVPNSAISTNQTSIGAGATIDARIGSRRVGLDFSSRLDRFVNTDPSSSVGLSNQQMAPVYIPAGAAVNTKSLSAGLAVPVSNRMTANFGVESQHLLSDLMPFDAYNTIYGAGLTYKMKGPGAISLYTKQYRYQDNLIPQNAFTQTSTDLTFTVRF